VQPNVASRIRIPQRYRAHGGAATQVVISGFNSVAIHSVSTSVLAFCSGFEFRFAAETKTRGLCREVPFALLNQAHQTIRIVPVYRLNSPLHSHIEPGLAIWKQLRREVMSRSENVVGLAVLGALAFNAAPAAAQVQPNSQEVHAYGGEMFGDDLTDSKISGRTPKLDDDFTYGVRYGYNFTSTWGIELSLGQSASSVTELASGDVDLDLSTLDVDAVWHFNSGSRFVPYAVAGIGYASADLDAPIRGAVNGTLVSIEDDSGFTLNAGLGAKYFATDRFLVRLEARYRYLDSIDNFGDSLNTFETTVGVGWRF
jgi:outer membrane beta-barrel protein